MNEQKKALVLYHANCLDGFGAAFAAWLKLGDTAKYVPVQYGDFPEDYKDREVYILDFSFPKPIMDDIFEKAKHVVWLDHHKSAFESWCGGIPENGVFENVLEYSDAKDYIRLDNNRSGALLSWMYFHSSTKIPMLFRIIDDYDRWQFKIDDTKATVKSIWSYAPWSFEQWDGFNDPVIGLLSHEGKSILRAHEQNVKSVVNGATMKCDIRIVRDGEMPWTLPNGLAANCPPHLISDVGHLLALRSGTYGLCWYQASTGKIHCSLRSNGDYDVSKIAKAFNGGGHRNAAGFEIGMETLQDWLRPA